ncbi:hypothetical protein WAI453_005464 [Rhynchosporium graminicola]
MTQLYRPTTAIDARSSTSSLLYCTVVQYTLLFSEDRGRNGLKPASQVLGLGLGHARFADRQFNPMCVPDGPLSQPGTTLHNLVANHVGNGIEHKFH